MNRHDLILMEAAVVERLRRCSGVSLHSTLVNAPLIYDEEGCAALSSIYREYMQVAEETGIPLILCTPTWRANRERVDASGVKGSINTDAVQFMRSLNSGRTDVRIGGMLGCRNDCYKPEEGLSSTEAEAFHAWQINQLADAGVDFLLAETLPFVEEAEGIAKAVAATDVPYVISFVISRDGHVLDGTPLLDAVRRVDAAVDRKPMGFMVNCAYPTFLCVDDQPPELFDRLIGYQANASSLDHCDLDNADQLQSESVEEWAAEMRRLNRAFGMKILGGCCGTTADHLRAMLSS
ncbi:homocysteine S-methyltransferase family protein [Tichowtungia aerotolerans]|uniref:Homocysteine S-methyltransferase family protein n=1 Tax=Tichowtungia aerotolerans TaxID=2697043 RepID=A0A6P1M6H1_9BACT|nr:homocysteine S-methyltransferase family protein [Tichowtungia aerotolerans]QHI69451.1 homocysteine S-methyltransferase family protein [Tichowtungia aerotolerans]